MTMTRISRNDWNKVKAYEELTGAIVKVDGGVWIIDAPEEMDAYATTADLMEFINWELAYTEELYKENGQLEDLKEIYREHNLGV